jgi:hypothetical protein
MTSTIKFEQAELLDKTLSFYINYSRKYDFPVKLKWIQIRYDFSIDEELAIH